MRLYWVRHGQMELRASAISDPRAIDRFFNQEEQAGLSPRGRREAQLVAERLRGEAIDAIYSSPLHRARETAELSAEALGLSLTVTPAISELRTGRLLRESRAARFVELVSRAPLRASIKRGVLGATLIPLYFHAWRKGRTVDGESPADLEMRVKGFFAELEARHASDARLALFAHGYLIFTLVHSLASSRLARAALWRRPYIPNGAITQMELERGELRLVSYAEATHLAEVVGRAR